MNILVGLFFLPLRYYDFRYRLPLKYRFHVLHMYVTLLSAMIIVPVVALGYYCRTKDT